MNTPDRNPNPPDPQPSGIPCAECGEDIWIGEKFYRCEKGEWFCSSCKQDKPCNCDCYDLCYAETMTAEYAREYHREGICDD